MSRQPQTHFASVDPKRFTQALSLAANGVTIVTTDGPAGKAGLTVSSMCSVCAEPPVILVCVNTDNEFCEALAQNQHFAVNLLATNQTTVSQVFAGFAQNPEQDRFMTGHWDQLSTGSPVLQNALVTLDCELSATHSHGTHNLYIGRVVDLATSGGDVLVYCERQYSRVTDL